MKRHVHLDLEPCPICAADRKETPMRQSTMVAWVCLLVSSAACTGALAWAGLFRGSLLVLLGAAVATTFAIAVDLREHEERAAGRWPPR